MIVCHCRLVTDAALRALVAEGRCDLDEVTARCGAAGECGGCKPGIEALLEQIEQQSTRSLSTTSA